MTTRKVHLRSSFLSQTIDELRDLKSNGHHSAYRSALAISAPGLVEALIERVEELESTSTEQLCEAIAAWLGIRMLGWCQQHQIPELQRETLFKLVEAVRTGSGIPIPCTPKLPASNI